MDFDTIIPVLTIYCEASSASQQEREAVAHVIINRTHDWRYSHAAAAVCMQPKQFSEFNGDAADWRNLRRGLESPNDPVMAQCATAWVMAKNTPDPTNGATHYVDKTIAPPYWAEGAVLCLETDKFRFYRDVK